MGRLGCRLFGLSCLDLADVGFGLDGGLASLAAWVVMMPFAAFLRSVWVGTI